MSRAWEAWFKVNVRERGSCRELFPAKSCLHVYVSLQGGSFISETTGFPTEIVFLLVKIQIRSGPGTQNVPVQPWFPKKKSVF